jgi:ADP-ribose pyrophosphatase
MRPQRSKMSGSTGGAPEEMLSSERVYSGRIVKLRIDRVRLPSGVESRREIVEHRGAVALVALDSDGNCLLVRQYRPPVGDYLLEIPAGTLEEGEDPADCAARELAEETGYRPGTLIELAGFFSAPGFCTEFLRVYLATDLAEAASEADEDEDIELVRLPLGECVDLVRSGGIRDAKSVVGLLAVHAGWGRDARERGSRP